MAESSINSFKDLYNKYRYEDESVTYRYLWHYTSVDGLTGIIRDKPCEHKKLHFWFSRSDCLNDTSEGTHILFLFRQTCSELLEQNVISQSFYEAIKGVSISNNHLFFYPIPPRDGFAGESMVDVAQCYAYICSFSMKEDSLDMWRYYSKGNGGYGLKCFSTLFDTYKKYEYSGYDENAIYCPPRSFKVIYDDNDKKEILTSIIKDTFSVFTQTESPEENKLLEAKRFIGNILQVYQFRFKHECFSSEQEYRFVIYVPVKKPEQLKNEIPSVKYRTQNGIIVPYIDITVESSHTCLNEVLISPFVNNQCAWQTTYDYLSQCGFNCKVRNSQLPVR